MLPYGVGTGWVCEGAVRAPVQGAQQGRYGWYARKADDEPKAGKGK